MADETGFADTTPSSGSGPASTSSQTQDRNAASGGRSADSKAADSSSGAASATGGSGLGSAAADVVKSVKTSAESVAGGAVDKLGSLAGEGKEGAAGALEGVAEALHKSAENFEGQQDFIAGLIERGSTELTTLATTLRSNDLQGLLGKLDDLARREPAVFVGAAMAAGFAAVRLGKVVVAETSSDDLPKVEMPKLKEPAQ